MQIQKEKLNKAVRENKGLQELYIYNALFNKIANHLADNSEILDEEKLLSLFADVCVANQELTDKLTKKFSVPEPIIFYGTITNENKKS